MFRLNRLTDYAVVVMSQMSLHPGRVRNTTEISRDSTVPLPTVAKILNALAKAGLVVAQRGASGGYALSRPPKAIAVSDIIQALEGPIALTACVTGATETCDVEARCPLSGHWNNLEDIAMTCHPAPSPHDEALDALERAFEDLEKAN
jgi:FeS assembly SUF system regulator